VLELLNTVELITCWDREFQILIVDGKKNVCKSLYSRMCHWNQKSFIVASGMVNVRIGNKEMVSIHINLVGYSLKQHSSFLLVSASA